MSPEIEEFAKILIEWTRDEAIRNSDLILQPTVNAAVAKRWATAAHEMSPEDFARVLIPDIVDDTLFHLLRAVDEGSLRLAYTASNGAVVDLTTEGQGELAGWYMGSGAWRAMYSQERFVDDFADLRGHDFFGAES